MPPEQDKAIKLWHSASWEYERTMLIRFMQVLKNAT
ncbi:hypothetical protein F904_01900 [Acinetobacter dispersus]|uniref:Uncharacterized protein n=1 Tax=Acinetobacter dispersus TaxID=70348 RepID=N9L6N8_9GAMM|nr:hypothetical protein F904_01900 [Acinetobacter dispersus]